MNLYESKITVFPNASIPLQHMASPWILRDFQSSCNTRRKSEVVCYNEDCTEPSWLKEV